MNKNFPPKSINELEEYYKEYFINSKKTIFTNKPKSTPVIESEEPIKRELDENIKSKYRKIRRNRNEVVNWLASLNTQSFLTITFKKGFSDYQCVDLTEEFLKRINRYYYGRRHVKKNLHLTFIVREERQSNCTLHYHIFVINEPYMTVNGEQQYIPFDSEKFNNVCSQILEQLNNKFGYFSESEVEYDPSLGRDKSYQRFVNVMNYHVLDYYNDENKNAAEEYMVKGMSHDNPIYKKSNDYMQLIHCLKAGNIRIPMPKDIYYEPMSKNKMIFSDGLTHINTSI